MEPNTYPALKKIRELSPDGRFWRVDWFCGITGSERIAEDRMVTIIISPFRQDVDPFEAPSSITSVDDKSKRIVRTSIGNLPCIHIGSVWKDGYYQDPRQFKFTEMRLRRVSFEESTFKVIRADHRLENGSFLIDKKYWPISLREGLNAKCLHIDHDDEPYSFIIPMMEVIRFYYATSTKVIQHLVSDEYYRTNGNCMYDSSQSICKSLGNSIIHLRKDFDDNDAWTAARLAFDRIAHDNAVKIFTSLASDRKNGQLVLHPETFPPFFGNTTLLTYGKRIVSGDGLNRFLIFWIAQCSASFPFRELSASRDNPGTPSDKPARSEIGYQPRNAKPKEFSEFLNQDDDAPSSNIEITRLSLPSRFTYLNGKELNKIYNSASEFRANRQTTKKLDETPNSLSTSPQTTAESKAAPASFSSEEKEKEIIYSYDRLIMMFKGFEKIEASGDIDNWSMIKLAKCKTSTKLLNGDYNLVANLFPAQDSAGFELPKHFTHHHTSPSRGMLVVKIQIGVRYLYLFEILRKEYENFAAVLVRQMDFGELDEVVLLNIIIECARNEGRWLDTINVPNVVRHRITHHWKTEGAFVGRIKEMIS